MKNDRDVHDEPGRLLDGSDPHAPQELLRALRALRQEQPSPAMLDRVVERVANAPLTPESSAAGAVAKGAAVGKWLAGTGMLAVVGTVASLVWPSAPVTPQRSGPSAPVSSPSRASTPPAPMVAPTQAPEPMASAGAAQSPSTARDPEAQLPAKKSSLRSARARARRERAARLGGALPPSAPTHAAASGAVEPLAAPPEDEHVDAPESARERAPEVATQPAAKPREHGARVPLPSEAELLVRARALRRSDPQGALVLLEQHAHRFANGLLASEREVLAIEALRKLGRNDEATRRLAAFRARYPSSPHIRRLDEP